MDTIWLLTNGQTVVFICTYTFEKKLLKANQVEVTVETEDVSKRGSNKWTELCLLGDWTLLWDLD